MIEDRERERERERESVTGGLQRSSLDEYEYLFRSDDLIKY